MREEALLSYINSSKALAREGLRKLNKINFCVAFLTCTPEEVEAIRRDLNELRVIWEQLAE